MTSVTVLRSYLLRLVFVSGAASIKVEFTAGDLFAAVEAVAKRNKEAGTPLSEVVCVDGRSFKISYGEPEIDDDFMRIL